MQMPLSTVIIVTRDLEIEHRLGEFMGLLTREGIRVVAVDSPAEAFARLQRSVHGEVQCVVVDRTGEPGEPVADEYLEEVHQLASDPDIRPVVIARDPTPGLILAAFRFGAGDLIDLAIESDDAIVAILHQVAMEHYRRVQLRLRLRNFPVLLADLLKNLVRSERRTIDLEYTLAVRDNESSIIEDIIPDRRPTVLVVDDDLDVVETLVDRLLTAGCEAKAAPSAEDAIVYVKDMARSGRAVDLALLDIRLPGMNGLDAVRAMREFKPHLPVMLMTGYSDTETAIGAADLGVVGYVIKPFDDPRELIRRVKKHAVKSMNDTRDRHYLDQIKRRHAKFLLRYQKLSADLAQLAV